jgi:hypothetical protein
MVMCFVVIGLNWTLIARESVVSQGTGARQPLPDRGPVRMLRGLRRNMGTTADFTILVLLVALGVGLWTVLDRLNQLQRDVDALKRQNGVVDEPPADGR